MTLTKADIVETVAEQNGFTRARSFKVVETLLEIIKSTLESGEEVLVSGFGKFRVNEKKARRAWNIPAGKPMVLAARKAVTFRCSGKLREKINGHPNRFDL